MLRGYRCIDTMSIFRLMFLKTSVLAFFSVASASVVAVEQEPRASLRPVRDDLGRVVEVAPPPLRIVSLTPGATEMLFAAGAGAQLIATVQYSSEPPAAREVPLQFTNFRD